MANLIWSAFSDEYDDSIVEQAKALSGCGIRYTELRHADGKGVAEMSEADATEIGGVLADYGIAVSSVGSPLGKLRLDGDMDAHLNAARRVFAVANILGARYVRVFSFYLCGKSHSDCRGRVIEYMGNLLRLADSFGVKLCHENEAGIYGESPECCLDLLNTFNNLGCVFDGGNFVLDGFDAYGAYRLLKERVTYFHIKDALAEGAVVPPGVGEAKIREILTDYAATAEQDTFITLEPHLQTFDGLNALVGKSFENPYKYASPRVAFLDAVQKLKDLLNGNKD